MEGLCGNPEIEYPEFGQICPSILYFQCFLAYGLAMFFYFHIFTAPCLLFNLFGFVVTSWNLCCGIWEDA